MKQKEGFGDSADLSLKFEFNPKDGIDNPALSLAEDSEPEGASQLRFCFLKKEEEDERFDFCLRQEEANSGHVVRQVKPGGLAYRRGLREGDRVLEVNGIYVEDMEHLRVVWKIKSSGKQVLLTILDGNAYDMAKTLDQSLTQLLPHHNRPRLCCVAKKQQGFGFTVSAPEGVKGTFRLSVLKEGPADQAGVPDGSWLLELNGKSVRNWTCAQLNKKLKHSSDPMGLLVIEAESEEFYRQRGVKVMATMADASQVPFEVRKLQLVKGPDGYGFLLKEEKMLSGKRGQFLREVDAGMPAEKAGMKDGDLLLAVNGDDVTELDHQAVVLRIRAGRDHVTLLVIDAEGSKFYHLVGLSPLLFYEDQDRPLGKRGTLASSSRTFQENRSSTKLTPCACHLKRALPGNRHQLRQSNKASAGFSKDEILAKES